MEPMFKTMGFTLLELVMVMAIMAIISAVSIPALYSYAATNRLQSATHDLYSNLQAIRMKAVRANNRWAILFKSSGYHVVNCGPDNTCSATATGDDAIVKTVNLSQEYPGVEFFQDYSGKLLVFNSEGTSNADTITFTNAKNDTPKSVVVSSTGRIRIK